MRSRQPGLFSDRVCRRTVSERHRCLRRRQAGLVHHEPARTIQYAAELIRWCKLYQTRQPDITAALLPVRLNRYSAEILMRP